MNRSALKLLEFIAEPRVTRIFLFAAYLGIAYAGAGGLVRPSAAIVALLGGMVADVFSAYLLAGGIAAAVAVLPGVWWAERVGVILIASGLAMYFVIILQLGTTQIGLGVSAFGTLACAARWTQIRRFQLAPPKLGK